MDQDAAIAILLAQHEREMQAKEERAKMRPITIRNTLVSSKQIVKSPKQSVDVKKHTGPAIFGLSLPPAHSIDATEFIRAIRDAGKRPFPARTINGETISVIKVDHSKVRDDTIQAIAAYIGYDPRENFGPQEVRARAEAAKEIGYAKRPVRNANGIIPTRHEENTERAKGNTVVFGVHNHTAKIRADLQAQEGVLVDALIAADKLQSKALSLSTNPALTPDEQAECRTMYKQHHATFVLTEARLQAVRDDLAKGIVIMETFERSITHG